MYTAIIIGFMFSFGCADYIRIMPLGDSITIGPGCWRAFLWRKLQSNGYTNIDFVGTLQNPSCSGDPFDSDSEGHGGMLATECASENNLTGWLKQTNPQLILMHLGTNDIWANKKTEEIIQAFDTLLSQMRSQYAGVYLLVGQIPMAANGCAACPDQAMDLAEAIVEWANKVSTSSSPVEPVDLYTGWNAAEDTGDGVHPNDIGFEKMSNSWYPSVKVALDKIGGAKG
jgi:hypothetical protein